MDCRTCWAQYGRRREGGRDGYCGEHLGGKCLICGKGAAPADELCHYHAAEAHIAQMQKEAKSFDDGTLSEVRDERLLEAKFLGFRAVEFFIRAAALMRNAVNDERHGEGKKAA